VKNVFEELDQWIRRQLRCILWRQWKKPRTRAGKMIRLGFERGRAFATGRDSRVFWQNIDVLRVLHEPPYAERHVRWCGRLGP
jgi:hypothetical protein